MDVDRCRSNQSCREFRLKISLLRSGRFRDRNRAVSQSVSHHSALNAHQGQSETSCRLLAPLGAFVTTTRFFIVHTFIHMELPKSSSDKTDGISSIRNIINNKYYLMFFIARKSACLNVDYPSLWTTVTILRSHVLR